MATQFPEYWGYKPHEMPLYIVRGQDFRQEMPISGQELPPGSTARIELVNSKGVTVSTWTGAVSPALIEFSVESEDIDALPKGLSYYLYVVYPDTPDTDFCLTYGSVERL